MTDPKDEDDGTCICEQRPCGYHELLGGSVWIVPKLKEMGLPVRTNLGGVLYGAWARSCHIKAAQAARALEEKRGPGSRGFEQVWHDDNDVEPDY